LILGYDTALANRSTNVDELVKSRKKLFSVIPADPGSESETGAGIQKNQGVLDPGLRRGDGLEAFYEAIKVNASKFNLVLYRLSKLKSISLF
jgi:hypothetical protein